MLSDNLPNKPANVVNSAKLVIAGANYFLNVGQDKCRITNGLYRMDHRGASVQYQIRISFSSICIWHEPNHVSSVLAALSWSLCHAHHEVMSLIQHSSIWCASDTSLTDTLTLAWLSSAYCWGWNLEYSQLRNPPSFTNQWEIQHMLEFYGMLFYIKFNLNQCTVTPAGTQTSIWPNF